MAYIDDVTAAFELAGQQLLAGIWNNQVFQVCADHPLSLRKTVETMLSYAGLTLQARWGENPAQEREILRAIRLYPSLPDWRTRVTLEDGVNLFFGNENLNE